VLLRVFEDVRDAELVRGQEDEHPPVCADGQRIDGRERADGRILLDGSRALDHLGERQRASVERRNLFTGDLDDGVGDALAPEAREDVLGHDDAVAA